MSSLSLRFGSIPLKPVTLIEQLSSSLEVISMYSMSIVEPVFNVIFFSSHNSRKHESYLDTLTLGESMNSGVTKETN